MLDDCNNPNKLYPFTFAALNDMRDMVEYLKEQGDNIKKLHAEGNNLLHIAAYFNKIPAANYCIENEFDLNQQNELGNTALHLAAIHGHTEVIQLLLSNNADPLIANRNNFFPIHEATIYNQLEAFKLLEPTLQEIRKIQKESDVVHLSSQLETRFMLEYILRDSKGLCNIRDPIQQATPLHFAVGSKSLECSRFLIENGANVNLQDIHKQTPLHLAVELQEIDFVKLLVENGADGGILNADGMNPIDIAISDRMQLVLGYLRSVGRFGHYFR